MKKIFIDYGKRINTAILEVIKEILTDLSESKISSNHCFYITFKTLGEGVKIPKHLLKDYPGEMTIVLQNQYWNLNIKQNYFLVTLAFNKKKEILQIPFNSIIKFYDPFVKFSIELELRDDKSNSKKKNLKTARKNKTKVKSKLEKIVTLDDFRKKND